MPECMASQSWQTFVNRARRSGFPDLSKWSQGWVTWVWGAGSRGAGGRQFDGGRLVLWTRRRAVAGGFHLRFPASVM